MPNISKRKLDEYQLECIFTQWYQHISGLDADNAKLFFNALLGSEEQIMLAKRFAAIVMLMQGRSGYQIWNDLDLSPSTVENLREKFLAGHYEGIKIEMQKRQVKLSDILDAIDTILLLGFLPAYSHVPRRKMKK